MEQPVETALATIPIPRLNTVFCGGKEITLTEEQVEKIDFVETWAKSKDPQTKQILTLSGAAGTGKTVTIAGILDRLEGALNIGVVAFTGKDVSVLRRKSVARAQTLHSVIYSFDEITKVGKFAKCHGSCSSNLPTNRR